MPGKSLLTISVCALLFAASPASAEGWHVEDTISALDGSRSYAASLLSTNTLHSSAGLDEHSGMVIRCGGGALVAYITWPASLGTGPLDMRWKTDAGHFTSEVWTVSTDGSATFSENARAFLKLLRGAHNASFQLSLANFDSLHAEFTVDGADKVIDAAAEACRK